MPLAVDTYATSPILRDTADVLSLAWTLDERHVLAADTQRHLAAFLREESDLALPRVNTYAVDDPYGERALRPALESFFDLDLSDTCLLSGAGVSALLCAMGSFAARWRVYVLGGVYPDLPIWVDRRGGWCNGAGGEATLDDHLQHIRSMRPDLVFIERPGLFDDSVDALSCVRRLTAEAAEVGAIVAVDESNANYCAPSFSAIGLTTSNLNLLVLRGFSKAYGLGGLRLGYCVASQALREALRASIPPLGTSPLTIAMGVSLLRLGDIGVPLRERILAHRSRMTGVLRAAGIGTSLRTCPCLPCFFFDESSGTRELMEAHSVVGKRHATWRGSPRGTSYSFRLSIPLTEERMRRLEAQLPRERSRPSIGACR
jgi:histidinol-phosphate/aromatic aminotransferase/cobyric acid decarboxylase-like protein